MDGLSVRTQGSLVDETLKAMETDDDFKITAERLREVGAEKMSLDERKKRRRALDDLGAPPFMEFLAQHGVDHELTRTSPEILQLNIGLYCNQACNHCHVESSPKRTETMTLDVADHCLALLRTSAATHTLDLTGGAPELQPVFRHLVSKARENGFKGDIIDRFVRILSFPSILYTLWSHVACLRHIH